MTPVRIAVIDSGIAPAHPHVGRVAGGIALVGDDPASWHDRIGHGTAVAGAIRDLAPAAELLAVRVFESSLATTARLLSTAIDWAADAGAVLVNLSVGTTNEVHAPLFAAAIERARAAGTRVVAAARDGEFRLLPGALPGVIGVIADPACPRGEVRRVRLDGCEWLAASPHPRPIAGVPRDRNLSGVSFAVANATGVLAHVLATGGPDALAPWID